MTSYQPRIDEMAFILSQVLRAPQQLQALPPFGEVDPDLMRQILDEAGKFVGEVVAPLNRDGDETGCRFDNGRVSTPPGFRDAYQAFWQAGWPALAASPEDGGQGLPSVTAAAYDTTLAYWVADDYLRAVALTLLDWAWVQIAREAPLAAPRWSGPAQALQRWVMPELGMRLAIIDTALASAPSVDETPQPPFAKSARPEPGLF